MFLLVHYFSIILHYFTIWCPILCIWSYRLQGYVRPPITLTNLAFPHARSIILMCTVLGWKSSLAWVSSTLLVDVCIVNTCLWWILRKCVYIFERGYSLWRVLLILSMHGGEESVCPLGSWRWVFVKLPLPNKGSINLNDQPCVLHDEYELVKGLWVEIN